MSKTGFIYLLSNLSLNGILKIGFTKQNIEKMLTQLNDSTDMPMPYRIEASFRVENPKATFKKLRNSLHDFTLSYEKQFFRIDLDEAIKIIEELCGKRIEIEPYDAKKYYELGLTNFYHEKYEEAIRDYTMAIELDPDGEWCRRAYIDLANIYSFVFEEYDKAIKDFNRAIELDPCDTYVYAERATAYVQIGQYDKAIVDYTKAIELEPDDLGICHGERGEIYYMIKEYERAKNDFTKAIQLMQDNENCYSLLEDSETHTERGLTYHMLKEYDKAIRDYTRAIELNPYNEKAFRHRGNANYAIGKPQNAIGNWQAGARLGDEKSKDVLRKINVRW